MATFKICVFAHQKRQDKKFPVSIRVYWRGQSSYIRSEFYVTEKQINKKSFELKDIYIINELNRRIERFEEVKSQKLGYRIELYTAKELAKYLVDEIKPGSDYSIDFIEFSRKYIEGIRSQGRTSTAANMKRTLNALIDFGNGRDRLPIGELTAKFLRQLEAFLQSERVIKRKNQFGRVVTTRKPPVSDVTLFDYMTDIRVLFNAAMDEYNDEDRNDMKILHYPFRKYKLKRRPENTKRNLTPEQIAAIAALTDEELRLDRAIMARDVFLLSFYLVGINLVDLFEATKLRGDRLEYERSKTKGRRQDRAFISIRVEPEALPLVEKYADTTGARVFGFHNRYTTSHIFSSNVNKGLKLVAKAAGIDVELSTYYARHSWATIARNRCNVSKDDVDLALNHVDMGLRMADVYIAKDWSRVDSANRLVLDTLKNQHI